MNFEQKAKKARSRQRIWERSLLAVCSLLALFIIFANNLGKENAQKPVAYQPVVAIDKIEQRLPDLNTEDVIKEDIIKHSSTNVDEAQARELAQEITSTANQVGVEPELLACLFKQESNYNQSLENGVGATGLGQITPICEEHLNNRGHQINRYDRDSNILGSAIYLKDMLNMFNNDERLALAAYNAGPDAVQKFGGIPPYSETQHYVKKIMEHKQQMVQESVL